MATKDATEKLAMIDMALRVEEYQDELHELRVVCKKLQKDLRMRAQIDSEGTPVVDVSHGIWVEFCELIE